MNTLCSIKTNIDQANQMFDTINKHFYNGDLLTPTISMAVLHKKLGHSRYVPGVWDSIDGSRMAEIIIEGNITRLKNTEAVFQEMLECAVLHYCHQNHIKCSSGSAGAYHSKRFRLVAEAHGLVCKKHEKYGYEAVGINDEAKNLLKQHNWCFLVNREKMTHTTPNRYHSRRYVCPECGAIARTTKDAHLICGDCMKPMVGGICVH